MLSKISLLVGMLIFLTLYGSYEAYENGGMTTYFASVPKHIRPGVNITYTLWVKSSNPVIVSTSLYSNDERIKLKSEQVVTSHNGLINIGKLPLEYRPIGSERANFTMVFEAVDLYTGKKMFHNSTTMFSYASKTVSVLIQTDKAIYQPGDTIRFRAACLNPELRPLTGLVNYQVQDPNGNIVLLEKDVILSHGVAGGGLSLNKDAVNGVWKITYIVQGYTEELLVTVRTYKLPKFEVKLDTPSYIHPLSEGINIKLNAKYTYGKPVHGKALLKISITSTLHRFLSHRGIRTITRALNNYNGSASVFITNEEARNILLWNGALRGKFVITGLVTEEFTDTTLNDTAEILIERTHFKIEMLYKPETIKPGLRYTAYVRVSRKDGKLLMEEDRRSNSIILEGTFLPRRQVSSFESLRFPSSDPDSEINSHDIPANGIVAVSFTAKREKFRSVSFRVYTNNTRNIGPFNHWTANRAESPSGSFLQITTASSNVAPGDLAKMTIRTTEAISTFKQTLLSRGKIIEESLYVAPSGEQKRAHYSQFEVTSEMMPSVQILVTYIRSDGEVVADYLTLGVSVSLENQVNITSSATSVDAGGDVSIKVQTSAANSYVGLRAIDQSVLLLKSGNDISQNRIANDLNGYSASENNLFGDITHWWLYPRPSDAVDAMQVFEKAGVIVLTDGSIFQSQPGFTPYSLLSLQSSRDGLKFRGVAPPSRSSTTPSASTTTAAVRSFFPETWLWNDAITGSNGSSTFNIKAPDTITSWVLSAFSVSDEYGLGVAETSKITVFRNFFVSLNLPLKITRGEIIVVQAIVFNYLNMDVEANLTLTLDEGLELLIPGDDPIAAGPQRMLKVKSNGAVSVKFPVQSDGLGELGITASAVSQIAADALTRTVFVRPEGIKQCYSATKLFNQESNKSDNYKEMLEVRLPSGMVDGSAAVKLYVYGDILGGTMNNLGRLLVAPSGCGEQNMLGFAPDVFVTLYLKRARMLDAETRKKAFQHFYNGYMKELKYKHKDGSYSAFGERDDSGSTWLTAFVAKCFIFARKLRPELVETRIIDEAINFLVEQQTMEGNFNEPGKICHTTMQGGIDSPITMTAYVLITLRETHYSIKNKKVQAAARKARRFLESNLDRIRYNKYALAIVTYALHLSESFRASDALTALESLATIQGGLTYWQEATTAGSSYSFMRRRRYYRPPSNEIEMTAYALLTYVRRNDLGSAIPVMKWLTSKQNELGGYSSTQDTVIAVQALSNVAYLLIDHDQNLTITATHSHDPTFSESFDINESNSIVFSSAQIPPINGDLAIRANGNGIGVAQLSVCYNIPNDPYIEESFNCTTKVDSEDINLAKVNFCCKLKNDEDAATGMFVFEIGLLNGFTADKINEEERNPTAKLIEIDDDSVDIYYDQLLPGKGLCANVELIRYADVGASKPATLMAFDYYKPDRKMHRLYSVESMSSSGPCQVCGSQCVGCPGVLLDDWGSWSPCVKFCEMQNITRTRSCYEPNLNKNVDISRCGLQEKPTETRMCAKSQLSCPDFYDGLWYHMPKGFFYVPPKCNIFYTIPRSSPQSVIPGITLEVRLRSYVTCRSSSSNVDLTFKPDIGFSLSFLINPDPFQFNRSYTILSYGERGQPPIYTLEKLLRKNEFLFSINYGQRNNIIRNITTRHIPAKQWSHIIITWNKHEGATVYVNGDLIGNAYSVSRSNNSEILNLDLFLAKARGSQQDNVAGTFSALNYWSNTLPQDEVQSLSSFYREITQYDGPEPLLTPRHLRTLAPPSHQHCFRESIFLSELYAGTTDANKLCG